MTGYTIAVSVIDYPHPTGRRFNWNVDVDGVKAHGQQASERAARRTAVRRVRKLRRLARTLDVQSLIDMEGK